MWAKGLSRFLSSSWIRGPAQTFRPLSSSWIRGPAQTVGPLSSSWIRGPAQTVRPLSSSWRRGLVLMRQQPIPIAPSPVPSSQIGIFFDIDGVLVRGDSPLPAARRALRKLVNQNQHFRVPLVFITNAGHADRHQKAEKLSRQLDIRISPDQLVLSHSPLETMKSYHNKCVLVCGQGPVLQIAKSLGFQKVLTIEQLVEQHPELDMVNHKRRPKPSAPVSLPQIQAIILFGEPIEWETNLQLLNDVLLTNGRPGCKYNTQLAVQLPILACNTDLFWMADVPSPRFSHGIFLLCLESVYKKLTNRELQYKALMGKPALNTYHYAEQLLRLQNNHRRVSTIYAVGDNILTDIYGANLYNRYLTQHHPALQCKSILVCTGLYDLTTGPPLDWRNIPQVQAQSHREIVARDLALLEPHYLVADVEEAVDQLLQQ